jgi:hypothetical protein
MSSTETWISIPDLTLSTAGFNECGAKAQESREWYIEDQAFSLSYDLTPPPLSRQQVVSLSQSPCVSRVELLTWIGELDGDGGGGAKSYVGEKAWSSINHSILSARHYRVQFKLKADKICMAIFGLD